MSFMIGRVLQIIFCLQVTNDDHPDYYRTVCKSRRFAQGRQATYSRQKLRQGTSHRVKNSGDRHEVTSKWSCSTCVHTSEVALSRSPSGKRETTATNTSCDGRQRAVSERTFHRPPSGGRSNLRRISKFGQRNDRNDRGSRSRSNPRRVVSSYAFATLSEEGFSLNSNRSYVTRNQLKNVSSHTESEFMTRIKNRLYARDSGHDMLIKGSGNSLKRLETNKKPCAKKHRRRVCSSKDLQERSVSCENSPTHSEFKTKLHSTYCKENIANESKHLSKLDRKSHVSEPAPTISETTLEQLEKFTVFKSKCYKSSNSGKSYKQFKNDFDNSKNVFPGMKSDRRAAYPLEKLSQRVTQVYNMSNNAEKLSERTEEECQQSGESEQFSQKVNHDVHYESSARKSIQRAKNLAKPNSSVNPLKNSVAKLNISNNSFYSSKTKIQTSSLSITSASGNNSDRSFSVIMTHSSHKSMRVTSGRSTNCKKSKANGRLSESSWEVARHTESLPLLTTKSTLSSWSDESSQSSE